MVKKDISERISVITEPVNIDSYALEFEGLEEIMTKMEAYLFAYEWGSYAVLVLPASFPFGGMENPLLTFASPTIVTGDKS